MDPDVVKRLATAFVGEVSAVHQKGAGAIPLERLIGFCGLPTPAPGDPRLAGGALALTSTGSSSGRFRLAGQPAEIPTPLATIVVPAELAGTYESAPDQVAFVFDKGRAPYGARPPALTPLDEIRVDAEGVHLRVGGYLGPLLSYRIGYEGWAPDAHPANIVNLIRSAYLRHMIT